MLPISRESLIGLLARFYEELDIQMTGDEKSGYIIMNKAKDTLMSNGESGEIPADNMIRLMPVMTHGE